MGLAFNVRAARASLAGVLLLAARALASDGVPGSLLEWDAPADCPEIGVVWSHLGDVLGREPSDLWVLGRVRAVINANAHGYELTLELFEGARRRSRLISSNRCDELAEAAAVAIGLALDDEMRRTEESAAASARDEMTTSSAAADTPSVTAAGGTAASPIVSAQVDAVLDARSLSAIAPGVSIQGHLRLNRTSLGIYGTYLPPIREYVRADQYVDFSLLAGGARVCQRAFDASIVGAACAGLEVGSFAASGGGLIRSRNVDNLWLAPAIALELGAAVWDSLGVQLRSEALLPLARRRYTINDSEAVFQPPALAFRLYLGAVWSLD